MKPASTSPSRWRGSALLVASALGILLALALRISSIGGSDPGAIQACLDRMRDAEWATCRGEPYRAEALAGLEQDTELLRALVGPDIVLDTEQFQSDLREYAERAHLLRTSARIGEEALWGLHELGTRLSRASTEGRSHARTVTARWRIVFFGYLGLLLALGMHALWRSRRALVAGMERVHPPAPEPESAREGLAARLAELETRLAASREEAERARGVAAAAAGAARSAFLVRLTQELRAPAAALQGLGDQLLDPGLTPDGRVETAGAIRGQSERLLQLLDDLRDLARIECGELRLEAAPCALFPLLSEFRGQMSARAARRGLEFRLDLPRPLPDAILIDARRLKQVLLTLASSAVEQTEHGFVRVTVAPLEKGESSLRLCIRVEDTSRELDAAGAARLAGSLSAEEVTRPESLAAGGLGLWISARLVERFGGRIEVQGRPQMGSRIEFTIEAGLAPGSTWRSAEALDAGGSRLSETRIRPRQGRARVLLAEDGDDNRRLIAHLVRRAGLDLVAVENGAEAVESLLRERAAGKPFDLVLMDMQMPVLDGYSATRKLRELGVRTPIVALTANAMSTDRQRCLEAGCDEFCAKPIDFDEFFATLERSLARGRSETPAALPQGGSTRAQSDDPGFAGLVELFVSELGEEVDALRRALLASDAQELARLAHQLKGSCGSYGFPELSRRAAELERAAKQGAGGAELESAFSAFEKACASVRSSASAST